MTTRRTRRANDAREATTREATTSESESEDEASDESDESDDDASATSELELAVDELGRIACEVNRYLTYETTSATTFAGRDALDDDDARRLTKDCEAAHTAKNARGKRRTSGTSSGRTFWVNAESEPRCALEYLARETFRRATREAAARAERDAGARDEDERARYDPSKSGAEWWTQVIDEGDEIGWHWDKDYALEGAGVNAHPQLGTVTYFCDGGTPTVVVNRPTKVNCDYENGDVGVCGDITECVVSWPKWGKQITFDGRFLHGAPSEFARGTPQSSKRVTFLVNVWLNHKPITAEPLSQDELATMQLRDVERARSWVVTTGTPPSAAVVGKRELRERSRRTFDFKFKYSGAKRHLELTLPLDFSKNSDDASSSEVCAGDESTRAVFSRAALGELR